MEYSGTIRDIQHGKIAAFVLFFALFEVVALFETCV
jgi:hypothetical protein